MSLFKLESVQFSEFLLQLHCSIYHECSQWNLIFSPQKNAVPSTSTGFNLSDAWNGGSSLSIGIHPQTRRQWLIGFPFNLSPLHHLKDTKLPSSAK